MLIDSEKRLLTTSTYLYDKRRHSHIFLHYHSDGRMDKVVDLIEKKCFRINMKR